MCVRARAAPAPMAWRVAWRVACVACRMAWRGVWCGLVPLPLELMIYFMINGRPSPLL
jgi:hypothetical protein